MKLSRHWLWLLLVPVFLGFSRIKFDVEVLNLLPESIPVVQGLKLYQTNFANARELIITISAPDSETAEGAARSLALSLRTQTNLVRTVAWQPLWQEYPDQSAELIAYLWLNKPPEVFGNLTNHLSSTNLPVLLRAAQETLTTSMSAAEIARRSYDPLRLTEWPDGNSGGFSMNEAEQFFSSDDGTFRLLYVQPRPNIADYRVATRWLREIKSVEKRLRDTGEVPARAIVRYTGGPAFVSEISNNMQSDLAGPSGATLAIIAVLFYWAHRRWLPLLWLIVLLIVTLAATLAIGALLFGTLSVVSLGFASILLGLAEDFAIVLYQESRVHPELSLAEVQKQARPGIFWSAVTTSGAFVLLMLGGLPGLAQLGALVAIGIVLAAFIMLYAYLPPLMKGHGKSLSGSLQNSADDGIPLTPAQHSHGSTLQTSLPVRWSWIITAVLLGASSIVLSGNLPKFDASDEALRPQNSEAYNAAAEIKTRLNRIDEPLWILVSGKSEAEVLNRLVTLEGELSRAVSNQLISSFTLSTPLWPKPFFQHSNQPTATLLVESRGALREAVLSAGFTTNSLALTENLLATWERASRAPQVFWPTNLSSTWIMDKMISRTSKHFSALGLAYLPTNQLSSVDTSDSKGRLLALANDFHKKEIFVSGWNLLGYAIFTEVKEDFWRMLAAILLLLVVSLWLTFRSIKEMILSITALIVSGLFLWTIMSLAGWSWNLMNLMALPLLLGLGVDYCIHMLLALHRYQGDLALTHRGIGRALMLAGSTTVAGFGSLAWSSNAGMASLGRVCAVGILCCMGTAIFLLPSWWRTFTPTAASRNQRSAA